MAAALTASPAEAAPYQVVTVTGSGFAITTNYTVTVTTPQGTANYPVTSDGTGAFTLTVQVDEAGSNTITATPIDQTAATLTFTTAAN